MNVETIWFLRINIESLLSDLHQCPLRQLTSGAFKHLFVTMAHTIEMAGKCAPQLKRAITKICENKLAISRQYASHMASHKAHHIITWEISSQFCHAL